MNNLQNTSIITRILKLVGVILILSFLIDFLILLFSSGVRNSQGQIALATSSVDRGLIPLIGLALIFASYAIENHLRNTAYWMNENVINSVNQRRYWLDLGLWAVLSSLLGLFFLVLIPLHINNTNLASVQTIGRINEDAKRAETSLQAQIEQVKTQVEQQRSQFKNQVQALLQNEQLFNQAIASNQYSESDKKLLQQFKANPQALDKYLAQQEDPVTLANQKLNQIRQQKTELEQQARDDAKRSSFRVGINSLLLAIGYIIIGWTGLKNIRGWQSARRQPDVP